MTTSRKSNRICPSCKERMAVSYSTYCKPCASKISSKNQKKAGYKYLTTKREKIHAIIVEAKDVPCADCGIRYPPYVMDFDHQRDKKFNISSARSKNYSLQTLKEEIDKCEIVCANCHRERTYGGLA